MMHRRLLGSSSLLRWSSSLLRWLLAVCASAYLLRIGFEDGLDATLGLAPLVVAALAELAGQIRRRGGSRPGPVARQVHQLGLFALVAGSVGVYSIRLPLADRVWLALYVLVVLQRVVSLTIAARPLLGQRLPERPSVIFLLLPLTLYVAFVPWALSQREPNGDESHYLLITHSLAFDFDARLSNNYAADDWMAFTTREVTPQPGDPVGPDGELYSRHNLALPLLLAPGYRIAGRSGALVTMALLTALLAWSLLRLARRYFPDRTGDCLLSYALFAFTPPTLIYAAQIWVEVPAALLVVLALDCSLAIARSRGRNNWLGLLGAVVGLVLLKLRFGLLVPPLLALAAWRSPSNLEQFGRRQIGSAAGLIAALLASVLFYNHLVFGNALKIYRLAELSELFKNPPEAFAEGLLGLFFDCAFGLFFVAPIWMLLLFATPQNAVDRRRWWGHLAILFSLYFVVLVPRTSWFGGFSPPFRYGYVLLPMLALGLVPALAQRHRSGVQFIGTVLVVATVILTVCWVVVPGWTYNLAHGRTHLLDHLSLRFGQDVARFFPSLVRPRVATWVWPIAAWLTINAIGRWPQRRSRATTAIAVLAVLTGTVALPIAAARLPTQRIECEDPAVSFRQGQIYPPVWTPQRILYRGGLLLGGDGWMQANVQPGGTTATLSVDVNFIAQKPENYRLELSDGQKVIGSIQGVERREWRKYAFELTQWPENGELLILLDGPRTKSQRVVIIDRVTFDWH